MPGVQILSPNDWDEVPEPIWEEEFVPIWKEKSWEEKQKEIFEEDL